MHTENELLARVSAAITLIAPDIGKIDGNLELLESGLLDSLSVMRLIAQVEKEFGIKLPLMELTIESLATPKAITSLVARQISR